MDKGILVVISGFSGAGKGTLMNQLIERFGDDYALSISATTRAPRSYETDGKEYFFITKEQFEGMIADGALIEYAKFVDNYYGTPKKYVFDQLEAGKNVILEIEIQGALQVKKKFPDTRLIFVSAPSAEELHRRLTGRGTESAEEIQKRLQKAVVESEDMEAYDYLVINDQADVATEELHRLITNERNNRAAENAAYRADTRLDFINQMRNELKGFSKGD